MAGVWINECAVEGDYSFPAISQLFRSVSIVIFVLIPPRPRRQAHLKAAPPNEMARSVVGVACAEHKYFPSLPLPLPCVPACFVACSERGACVRAHIL